MGSTITRNDSFQSQTTWTSLDSLTTSFPVIFSNDSVWENKQCGRFRTGWQELLPVEFGILHHSLLPLLVSLACLHTHGREQSMEGLFAFVYHSLFSSLPSHHHHHPLLFFFSFLIWIGILRELPMVRLVAIITRWVDIFLLSPAWLTKKRLAKRKEKWKRGRKKKWKMVHL